MNKRSRVAVAALALAGALQAANANDCTTAATNLVANADYSSCVDGDVSGDTCTPTCSAGHATTAAAAGFTLTCDVGGSFDGADATLVCTGERAASPREWLGPILHLSRRQSSTTAPLPRAIALSNQTTIPHSPRHTSPCRSGSAAQEATRNYN